MDMPLPRPASSPAAAAAPRSEAPAAPNARHLALVAAACRRIEASATPPHLASLAGESGLSRFHFHRLFKQVTGLTPKAYASAVRADRVQSQLAGGARVTEAIYAGGFESASPFYANARQQIGMPPRSFRAGGRGETIRFAVAHCALGALLVAASDQGVCSILLDDDPQALVQALQQRFPRAELVGADAGFEQWVAQIIGFIQAPGIGLDLPLDLRGTAFQRRVWQTLRKVPVGQTVSYAELARRIGMPTAVRAVARACASNPLALAVPCHRVVRTDGGLSGYRWGVERKRLLLERELASATDQKPEKSKSMSSGTGTS